MLNAHAHGHAHAHAHAQSHGELESEVYSIFAEPLGLPECTIHLTVQKTWTKQNKADRL